MKTERVTLLTTPQFKAFLHAEAKRQGVSVAELVRSRCEGVTTPDEAALVALTAELKKALAEARRALRAGLDEAHAVLGTLQGKQAKTIRRHPSPAGRPRKTGGSAA